ncbi:MULTISPECIES: hypothetical protein [unclassified Yoonia]|uniref:hypothetical protein n=1 Tax=unclassified Yoonia TaxID=2629118 RepID=UPI002AFE3F63|nr:MULTISPECIES: hypothetical protein [unclassified Yoonia]
MATHDPSPSDSRLRRFLRFGLRFGVILGLVALAALGFDWLQAQLALLESDASARAMTRLIVMVLVVYALLLAMPFVPGVEIGIALLIIQGAAVAPFVYLATVAGLALAFLVGQIVSLVWLIGALKDLRLHRIAAWLDRLDDVPRDRRLEAMQDKLPRWLVPLVVKYRYATVAIAINTPGNIAFGGGGGIMLVAGLSRLFSTPAMIALVAFATAPVPLVVWIWGTEVLR